MAEIESGADALNQVEVLKEREVLRIMNMAITLPDGGSLLCMPGMSPVNVEKIEAWLKENGEDRVLVASAWTPIEIDMRHWSFSTIQKLCLLLDCHAEDLVSTVERLLAHKQGEKT